MKTLNELRLNFNLQTINSGCQVKYFKRYDIDFDVYLPSIGINLQREYCWNIEQQRELILSILIGRNIPHCAIMNCINKQDDKKDIYLVIDGKQRILTIFNFIDNKFKIIIDDIEYYFSELPYDYQTEILYYNLKFYIINEDFNNRITDEQKITWFKLLNFGGTNQDVEHLNKLK
jgi:uncharacterized protein with ParB-like and HNH nuclease domain